MVIQPLVKSPRRWVWPPPRPGRAVRRAGGDIPSWGSPAPGATPRARMEWRVPGPERLGRKATAWRRARRSRCQCSTVSGRTSSRTLRSTPMAMRHAQVGGRSGMVGDHDALTAGCARAPNRATSANSCKTRLTCPHQTGEMSGQGQPHRASPAKDGGMGLPGLFFRGLPLRSRPGSSHCGDAALLAERRYSWRVHCAAFTHRVDVGQPPRADLYGT